MSPLKPTMPMAPPYQARGLFSFCSMKRIAQSLGAPVTVTAQAWTEERVEGVHAVAQPALDVIDGVDQARIQLDLAAADDAAPSPARRRAHLSLRSTSEHMVSSDSSFLELRSLRICSRVGDGDRRRA